MWSWNGAYKAHVSRINCGVQQGFQLMHTCVLMMHRIKLLLQSLQGSNTFSRWNMDGKKLPSTNRQHAFILLSKAVLVADVATSSFLTASKASLPSWSSEQLQTPLRKRENDMTRGVNRANHYTEVLCCKRNKHCKRCETLMETPSLFAVNTQVHVCSNT